MARKKGWCFTYNNYDETTLDGIFNRCEDICKFVVVGKEVCPTTGTKHLQGYCLFNERKRFTSVKEAIGGRAHIEPAKGSPQQNYDYCTKSGDYETRGTLPKGKYSTLYMVCEELKSGTPLRTIALNEPETFVRHHRGLQRFTEILGESTVRDWKTEVIVYIGETGTGKSRKCAELCGSTPTYYKPRGKWWDGYTGQPNVIIDDFYGWIKYDELLRITDRYPHRVPVKFGYQQFLAKTIYITSNKPMQEWYTFDISALERRVTSVTLFKKTLFNKT